MRTLKPGHVHRLLDRHADVLAPLAILAGTDRIGRRLELDAVLRLAEVGLRVGSGRRRRARARRRGGARDRIYDRYAARWGIVKRGRVIPVRLVLVTAMDDALEGRRQIQPEESYLSFGRTGRRDAWWTQPLAVGAGLSAVRRLCDVGRAPERALRARWLPLAVHTCPSSSATRRTASSGRSRRGGRRCCPFRRRS